MTLRSKWLLRSAGLVIALAAAWGAVPDSARAQEYPSQDIRLICAFPAGSGAESGIPMDLTGWWAAMVPADTPKPVVERINQLFTQIVSSEETKKFLNSFGGDPFINKPEAAQALFLKAIKDWGDNIRMAKIQPQ